MRLKGLLCLILVILAALTPAMAHADSGTGIGTIGPATRYAGVQPGTFVTYDREQFGLRSVLTLTVLSIANSTVYYNYTEQFNTGQRDSLILWTNVDASVIYTSYTNGTYKIDYTALGTPNFFIGKDQFGGPEYKGSPLSMSVSFWGKILLGNWRSTDYISNSGFGATLYMEWDRSTGILTQESLDYYGAGNHLILKATNAWATHLLFWDTIFTVENSVNAILAVTLPIVGGFLLLYFGSFFCLGITDNLRVKKSRGLRHSVIPPWLKMILITIFLFIAIWIIVLFFVLPLIFGALGK